MKTTIREKQRAVQINTDGHLRIVQRILGLSDSVISLPCFLMYDRFSGFAIPWVLFNKGPTEIIDEKYDLLTMNDLIEFIDREPFNRYDARPITVNDLKENDLFCAVPQKGTLNPNLYQLVDGTVHDFSRNDEKPIRKFGAQAIFIFDNTREFIDWRKGLLKSGGYVYYYQYIK